MLFNKTISSYQWLYLLLLLVVTATWQSCDDVIEYSPYQNTVDTKRTHQNTHNINRLHKKTAPGFMPFTIALIADSHTYYDDLEKQIKYLNTVRDIDFIIHMGDITLSAINREFKWYNDLIRKSKVPVITLIGNHDYLANGYSIYKEMFGQSNFKFTYNGVKFVGFDDIVWEKHVKDPDFKWFSEAIQQEHGIQHVVPLAHIPPWDDQFSYGNELYYNYLMEQNAISLSVHGHMHRYDVRQPYGDVTYLTVPSCNRDQLVMMHFEKDTILFENITY